MKFNERFHILKELTMGYIVDAEYEKDDRYGISQVDFTVYEIASSNLDNTFDDTDLERHLKCSIKWDSCCHFWFGERDIESERTTDGYLHICGVHGIIAHIKIMEFLYKKAFELMDREPLEHEQWLLNDLTYNTDNPHIK